MSGLLVCRGAWPFGGLCDARHGVALARSFGMYADPATRQRFEQLDEDARFEEEAQALARRIRRAERLRDRALEILDEDDDA
jgi:hypothetical protein